MDEKLLELIRFLGENWITIQQAMSPEDYASLVAHLEVLQPRVDDAATPRAVAEAYTDLYKALLDRPIIEGLLPISNRGRPLIGPKQPSLSTSFAGSTEHRTYNRLVDVLNEVKNAAVIRQGRPGQSSEPLDFAEKPEHDANA